jgi:predicted nucleotidyltransferase
MKRGVKGKFKKLGVFIVYLFGSRATGREMRSSDIDIGIVLKDPPMEEDTRALYNDLYKILIEMYPSSKLDIVFLQIASLSLQYFAIKEGRVLFEEDPIFRADYENLVINQYLDFRPVLDFFDRVIMEKYAKT